jgi:hypothetical protein
MLTGEDIYLSGAVTLQGTRNLNPPHLVLLMTPLALLPLGAAAAAMWVILLGAIVLFAIAVFQNFPPRAGWIVFAIILISSASTVAISLINIGWPLAAATAWAYTWFRAGYVRRAVITAGCLASLKLFYLVFLPYWIWRRDWKAAAWFTATFCAVFTIGILVLGWQPYATWIGVLNTGSPLSSDRPMDASWHSIATRLLGAGSPAQWTWMTGAAVIVLATWWRLRSSRGDASDWALLLTAMLVISPLGWVYYVLIPALPATAVMLERHQSTSLKLIAVGLAVPPAIVVLIADRVPGSLGPAVINSIYAIALACAWFILAKERPVRAAMNR